MHIADITYMQCIPSLFFSGAVLYPSSPWESEKGEMRCEEPCLDWGYDLRHSSEPFKPQQGLPV